MRNKRVIVAVASCVFGIGMIFWGFRIGSKSPQEKVSPQKSKQAVTKSKKAFPAWNVALGNVVVLAPELGFNVKAVKGEPVDVPRISATIENQLLDLRDRYRGESEKNPNLMGGILLQLAVNSTGEIGQVREIASRIPDNDFKRDLMDAVSKWDFSQVVSFPVVINCPLVLVREGMDITTVVTWEKSLGLLEDKNSLIRTPGPPNEQGKAAPAQKQTKVTQLYNEHSRPQKSAGKSNSNIIEVKATTPIRKEPSYKSPSIAQAPKGAKISVVSVQGEWLEIRTNGSSGFIRKEFTSPAD
jgi:hypothetical protein